MTRRLRSPKRKHAGNRTYGYGNKKNNRGKGNDGGHGRAGYHKHKWMHTIKYEMDHITSEHTGFTNQTAHVIPTISLEQIEVMCNNGKIQPKDGVYTYVDKEAKLLSNGNLTHKVNLTVHSAAKKAQEKLAKQGSTLKTLFVKKPKVAKVPVKKDAKPGEAKPAEAKEAKPAAKEKAPKPAKA